MSARSLRSGARGLARRVLPGGVRRALRSAALPSVDVVVVVEAVDRPRLAEALDSIDRQQGAAPGVRVVPVADHERWQVAASDAISASTADVVVLLRGCDVLAPDAVRILAERLGRGGAPAAIGRLDQAGEPDPWLRRLQRAADALEPRLAATALRRTAWGGRALSGHDDWLCSPTLAGLFAEHGPPAAIAQPVATWYPDHGTRAYGATPSPLPGLAALAEQWARVEGRLGEDAHLTERWRRTVVGFELPRLLQDVERADPDQWAELAALARQAVGVADWTRGVGPAARALVWLAAQGRREDLALLAAEVTDLGDEVRTTHSGAEVRALWSVDGLPAEVCRLGSDETALVAHVARAGAGHTDLYLAIEGVDLEAGTTRVDVTGPDGSPRRTTVLPGAEATRWWDRRFQAALGVRVEGVGPVALHVTVRAGEVERSAAVAVPAVRRPAPSAVTIEDLGVDGDGLVLTGHGALDGLRVLRRDVPVPARVRRDGARARVELATEVFGRMTPLPPGSYRVVVGDDNVAVAAGLRARLPLEHRTDRHRLRAHLGPRGGLVVDLDAPLADDEAGRHAQEALRSAYLLDDRPADPSLVYFESYAGRTATDSPRAIFEELRARRPGLRLCWGVVDAGQGVPEGAEPVLLRSREWYAVLATARVLVLNTDTEAWFRRRPGQYLLQTFHGYPSKAMGSSQWEAQDYTPARVRELRARGVDTWSAILTPTPEMTRHYREQYAYDGPAFERGYPRDDALVAPDAPERRAAARRLLGIGDDQRAVLYAPTWREHLAFRPRGAAMTEHLDLTAAAEALGESYVVLLRGHRFHAPAPVVAGGARVVDVTAYPEVNDLILAADVSVLDYSSMRFDVALTGRPMVFLVPDLDDYARGSRRFLFPFEESAPGPFVVDTAGVVDQLLDPGLAERWAGPVAELNARFNPWQDGRAAARVVDGLERELDRVP